MTIEETKYLMEALEEVEERERIIKCNTIDRVLEIIDKELQLARECQLSTVSLWRVRQYILDLRGEHV